MGSSNQVSFVTLLPEYPNFANPASTYPLQVHHAVLQNPLPSITPLPTQTPSLQEKTIQVLDISKVQPIPIPPSPTSEPLKWWEGKYYDGQKNSDNLPHGTGRIILLVDRHPNPQPGREYIVKEGYQGAFNNGVPEGMGFLLLTNIKYKGVFKNGQLHGQGTWVSIYNIKYEGDFLGNKFHGFGKVTYPNGDVIEAVWNNNHIIGDATFTYLNGDTYKGSTLDVKPHGQGKKIYSNGDTFEGSFARGAEILGKKTYVNGDVYQGEFESGCECGFGKMDFAPQGDTSLFKSYQGYWRDGVPSGQGIYFFTDGSIYRTDYCLPLAPPISLFENRKKFGNSIM